MPSVETSGDLRGVLTLDGQLLYAVAVALTKTTKQSQGEVIDAIRRTFTTRGAWYLPSSRFGVRITPATKARLESKLKTTADWLIPPQTGEDKTARGGGLLAVPIVGPGRPRPTRASKVRADLKPSALGRRGVVLETRNGPVLFYRQNKRLVAFYGLERRAHITRRSTVVTPTVDTFTKQFGPNLGAAIAEALRTAK